MAEHAAVRPVFVDHTSDAGGAEYALARLLRTDQVWAASLVVPRATDSRRDVFGALPPAVNVQRVGPQHTSLTTSGNRELALLNLGGRLIRSTLSLLRAPARRRGNVLVANTTRASVYVTAAAIVTRQPVVVHIRDMIEPEAIGGMATGLMRRFVLPRAAGVIGNSRTALRHVEPYLRTNAVTAVIPSPSGLRRTPATQRVNADPLTVGIVARLDPWKGQDLLLRAFAQAFDRHQARLVIVGGAAFGHETFAEQLRALSLELGVSHAVEFVGHTDDVPAALERLDVCVQYSTRAEPLGQNVLQYLAAGKATIVADEGGPSEWVTDGVNGLTVAPRNVDELAAALRRLYEQPELRASLASRAAQTPGLLTDTEVGQDIVALLERVLDQ